MKIIFLGETPRLFHHCFWRCFRHWFLLLFSGVFIVDSICSFDQLKSFSSLLLQVFLFHQWFLLLFFGYFHFTNFLYRDFFPAGVLLLCLLPAIPRDLKELFLHSGVFYLTLLHIFVTAPWVLWIWESVFYSQAFLTLSSFPTFGTTCFYKGFTGAGKISLKVLGPPTEVQNTDLAHLLFESHNVQQKLLVVRFYLCVKATRNTISTFSRFWTYYLIAICIVKHISYPLCHWGS